MSKKRGSAEKLFEPIYHEGQDDSDFQRRVTKNLGIALLGFLGDENYEKARRVYEAWITIVLSEQLIKESPAKSEDMSVGMQHFEREILDYVKDAFRNRDGKALRILADIAEKWGVVVSPDAAFLIGFCSMKPHNHVFTFNRLLQAYAYHQGLKPPYDEAIEKRVRRLIKKLGIRVRKGQ